MFPLKANSDISSKNYVDDVFSTYTYTGNGAAQTITNGIDLAGKGGMVWLKGRTTTASHYIGDTVRGTVYRLDSSTANVQSIDGTIGTPTSTGFPIAVSGPGSLNEIGQSFISWTFRNAFNFSQVLLVTKVAGSNLTINLAPYMTTPGMVKVKRTDSTGSWYIWHRSLPAGQLLIGETTAAATTLGHITVSGTTLTLVNGVIADGQYHIECYAHDTSAEGIIQCGIVTTDDGSYKASASLGWEPQYISVKGSNIGSEWALLDTARGLIAPGGVAMSAFLQAQTSSAETQNGSQYAEITANGFTFTYSASNARSFVYLAIRRPNKPPTLGTQVYNAIARTGTGAAATVTGVGFAPDLALIQGRTSSRGANLYSMFFDRLRGNLNFLSAQNQGAENPYTADTLLSLDQAGVSLGADGSFAIVNVNMETYINHFFKRAPGVFDQVCYNGTGAYKTEAIQVLGVPAELWVVKGRSDATKWVWGSRYLNATEIVVMPAPAGRVTDATVWNSTYPTATALSLGASSTVNTAYETYTAYLWASKVGISKVFSYTGDGTTGKTIDCNFTTGARFIMILRTTASTAQDIFIWDSTRGIISGNDPHLSLNTTAPEVTTDDTIDPTNSGFIVNQVVATNCNVNGATYIGLAYA